MRILLLAAAAVLVASPAFAETLWTTASSELLAIEFANEVETVRVVPWATSGSPPFPGPQITVGPAQIGQKLTIPFTESYFFAPWLKPTADITFPIGFRVDAATSEGKWLTAIKQIELFTTANTSATQYLKPFATDVPDLTVVSNVGFAPSQMPAANNYGIQRIEWEQTSDDLTPDFAGPGFDLRRIGFTVRVFGTVPEPAALSLLLLGVVHVSVLRSGRSLHPH